MELSPLYMVDVHILKSIYYVATISIYGIGKL